MKKSNKKLELKKTSVSELNKQTMLKIIGGGEDTDVGDTKLTLSTYRCDTGDQGGTL